VLEVTYPAQAGLTRPLSVRLAAEYRPVEIFEDQRSIGSVQYGDALTGATVALEGGRSIHVRLRVGADVPFVIELGGRRLVPEGGAVPDARARIGAAGIVLGLLGLIELCVGAFMRAVPGPESIARPEIILAFGAIELVLGAGILRAQSKGWTLAGMVLGSAAIVLQAFQLIATGNLVTSRLIIGLLIAIVVLIRGYTAASATPREEFPLRRATKSPWDPPASG
jgi:hypothetical protein